METVQGNFWLCLLRTPSSLKESWPRVSGPTLYISHSSLECCICLKFPWPSQYVWKRLELWVDVDGKKFPRNIRKDRSCEKGPIEKGPIVSHHWAPLFLCSSTGIYGSVCVFFASRVLVLLNYGQIIPLWKFQSVSFLTHSSIQVCY